MSEVLILLVGIAVIAWTCIGMTGWAMFICSRRIADAIRNKRP